VTWRGAALSGGSIVLVALVWIISPELLDWIGLADFDPLDRICLVFLALSVVEIITTRWTKHDAVA
jgi:hypothetical protein